MEHHFRVKFRGKLNVEVKAQKQFLNPESGQLYRANFKILKFGLGEKLNHRWRIAGKI